MDFPWKAVAAVSAAAAFVATSALRPHWSTPTFARYYACSYVLGFLSWALWAIILYPKVFSPLRGLPEPANNSWYNGQWAKIRKLPSGVPMQEWVNTIPNDGVIRYLGLLNQERILVTSPKALAEVLVTKNYDFVKPPMMRFGLGRILGFGILLAEGDEHRFQRKHLMPAFAFRHVKDLYPIFWEKAREGVQAMTQQVLVDAAREAAPEAEAGAQAGAGAEAETTGDAAPTACLEVGGWASRITLDIIGVAGLGRDFGAIADPTNELFQTYNALFQPSGQARVLGMLGLVLPGWLVNRLPVRRNGDVAAAARTIRSTCRALIREKRARLAAGKARTDVDILSVALESGAFTDEGLVDQLMTFLAAGHETTASSMTWAVYLLCRFPDVQRRLRREVRARLPPLGDAAGAGAPVSSVDVDHMPYLHAVCAEVLRYLSPVPMTVRDAGVDTTIQGRRVPKGTRVILGVSATNKDPALWGADAGQFNPDRWLPRRGGDGGGGDGKAAAGGGATSNYALMTFLHGPRSCIGMSFARAEFACLLAAWVGRMEFELRDAEDADEDALEIKSGVTARPAKGMHVRVRVLDGW